MGLGLTEGIETGLSVRQSGFRPIWACTSAGSVKTFPILASIEHLTVFADNDEAGRSAGRAAVERWTKAGMDGDVIVPKGRFRDFNDGAVRT